MGSLINGKLYPVLTERHRTGRTLEQVVTKALPHLNLDLHHNDYSDDGYPRSQSPVDHWNGHILIEDKNPSGLYQWTKSWVKKNIVDRVPRGLARNKIKILIISTISSLTKPAFLFLVYHSWIIIEVGYQVKDPDDSNAIYKIITQLDPIVNTYIVQPLDQTDTRPPWPVDPLLVPLLGVCIVVDLLVVACMGSFPPVCLTGV